MQRDPSLIPLSHQHQHGLALTVLIDRGLKNQPTREKALELAGKVARMADAELLGHFQVEEEVLFPAVRPHLVIEERQLFQEIQAKLDDAQLADLGKQVDANVRKVCPVTDKLPWE